jgi:acyl-CoA synthetase (AMP-forming)/AMP-acid ligase II
VVTITAHAAESDFYSAAELSKTITILHAEQTIEWAYVGKTIEIGDSINLFTDITTAVATSGLEVAYEYSADWANYVNFDEITGAIVEIEPGSECTVEELEKFCTQLPRYKRPKQIILADVPRNATGKIEKPVLRKRYGAERLVEQENQS